MSESKHGQEGHDDDCDNCKEERRENQILIDFYERLNKMQKKVGEVKNMVKDHQLMHNNNHCKVQKMEERIKNKPFLDSDQLNVKSMGYQLASLLLQKKIKMQEENKYLKGVVRQMQKDKEQHLQNLNQMSFTARFSSQHKTQELNKFELNSFKSKNSSRYNSESPSKRFSRMSSQLTNSFLVDSTRSSCFQVLVDAERQKERHIQSNICKETDQQGKQGRKQQKQKKQKIDLSGLNLWLYDVDILPKMEEQLYNSKKTSFSKVKVYGKRKK